MEDPERQSPGTARPDLIPAHAAGMCAGRYKRLPKTNRSMAFTLKRFYVRKKILREKASRDLRLALLALEGSV